MPIELSWLQPKRVMYERFYDPLQLEDIATTQHEALQYLMTGDAPVHCIVDISAVKAPFKSLKQARGALSPNTGDKVGRVVLIVGKNAVNQFLTSMISQTLFKNLQFTFCTSLEDALAYLRQMDPTVTIESLNVVESSGD